VPKSINPADKAQTFPSGRGHSGGSAGSARIDQPYRNVGMPPKKTNGSPSSSFDVNASQIMQNMIMNDDDKEWYELLFKRLHKDFLKPNKASTIEPSDRGMNSVNSGLELSLSSCLLSEELVTEPDDTERKKKKKKKKDTSEINTVASGNIAGYTLPLGASNQTLKARKKASAVNARAFGGGKVCGKF
jgi:hypothetical protein